MKEFTAAAFDTLVDAQTVPVAQIPRPVGAGQDLGRTTTEAMCNSALHQVCHDADSGCLVCAGQKQHQLRVAGCDDSTIRRYCVHFSAAKAVGPVRLYLQDLPAGQRVKIGVRPYSADARQRRETEPSFFTLTLPTARYIAV